jgi:hypothetical protein
VPTGRARLYTLVLTNYNLYFTGGRPPPSWKRELRAAARRQVVRQRGAKYNECTTNARTRNGRRQRRRRCNGGGLGVLTPTASSPRRVRKPSRHGLYVPRSRQLSGEATSAREGTQVPYLGRGGALDSIDASRSDTSAAACRPHAARSARACGVARRAPAAQKRCAARAHAAAAHTPDVKGRTCRATLHAHTCAGAPARCRWRIAARPPRAAATPTPCGANTAARCARAHTREALNETRQQLAVVFR